MNHVSGMLTPLMSGDGSDLCRCCAEVITLGLCTVEDCLVIPPSYEGGDPELTILCGNSEGVDVPSTSTGIYSLLRNDPEDSPLI